jgi:hypothetical protein
VKLEARLPADASAKLRLTLAPVGGEPLPARDAILTGGDDAVFADFGAFDLPDAHQYYTLTFTGLEKSGRTFGDLKALLLDGPAAADAEFNLEARRNAASVHLGYPVPKDAQVAAFYCEVTPREEPLYTYYEACGWHRGYFGMQVNGPHERRIIFSVWDAGGEAKDRGKVADDNRVKLLAKGDGVVAGDFGNEGTGGHSHLVYPWQKDQTYRFLLTAQVDGTFTTYAGWFYFPEKQAWGLIARFRAPRDGAWPHGLYSFNENFGGSNGYLRRLAEFGNQWIKLADGTWRELTEAHFTHDGTGKICRHDYGAGVTDGRFWLSNGGFVAAGVKYGDVFTRPAGGKAPDIALPESSPVSSADDADKRR